MQDEHALECPKKAACMLYVAPAAAVVLERIERNEPGFKRVIYTPIENMDIISVIDMLSIWAISTWGEASLGYICDQVGVYGVVG